MAGAWGIFWKPVAQDWLFESEEEEEGESGPRIDPPGSCPQASGPLSRVGLFAHSSGDQS